MTPELEKLKKILQDKKVERIDFELSNGDIFVFTEPAIISLFKDIILPALEKP